MRIADLVANRRIHQKLALISLLFLLPLAFVVVSLVVGSSAMWPPVIGEIRMGA